MSASSTSESKLRSEQATSNAKGPKRPKELRNKVSQQELKARLAADPRPRSTISFYRYHPISDPKAFRDELFRDFTALEVLGRIHVAHEGINAQLSVPTENLAGFRACLEKRVWLRNLRLNFAIEDDGKSFWVLTIKVRPTIVADGIADPNFSMERTGQYLNAAAFNELVQQADTVVVDVRNYYEYEVGHFEGALEVPADTFSEQLPMAVDMLQAARDKPVVMYCTGGIRCEKASAYLLHHGFEQVYHLEGGIIEYARQVKQGGLENRFRGKNFVFDNRLGERISEDIISQCHQCGAPCDTHHNCSNTPCHLLFIQCPQCAAEFAGCCSAQCRDNRHLSPEEQAALPPEMRRPEGVFSNSQVLRRARFFDVRK